MAIKYIQTPKGCVAFKSTPAMNSMRKGWILTPEQKEAVVADYLAGKTYREISRRYGVKVWGILSRRLPLTRLIVQPNERSDMWRRINSQPAPQISPRTVVAPPKKTGKAINADAFSEFTPLASYWAGMMMSDGCVNERGDIVLQLATRDGDHVFKYRDFLESSHAIIFIPPTRKYGLNMSGAYRFAARCRQIVADLDRIGVTPRKSLTAYISGLSMDRDFWRGIIDGDGSLDFSPSGSPRVRLACSPYIVSQFFDFIKFLLPEANPHIEQRSTILRLTVNGKHAALLVDALYGHCNIALPRKLQMAKDMMTKHNLSYE